MASQGRRFRGSPRATDSAVVPFGWNKDPTLPVRQVVSRAIVDVMAPRWVPIVAASTVVPLSWFTATPLPPNTIGKRTPQHYRFGEVRGPPLGAFPRADVWGSPNRPNPTAKRSTPQFVESGKVTFTPVSGFTPTPDDWQCEDELPPKGHAPRVAVYLPHSGFVSRFADFVPKVDAWHQDPQVPVRRVVTRQDARNDFVSTFPAAATVVLVDRWNADPVVPVRRIVRSPEFTSQPSVFPFFAQQPTIDKWLSDQSMPVRRLVQRPHVEPSFVPVVVVAPSITVDEWHRDAVVPVLRPARRPEFTAAPGYVPRFVAVIATPDMFHRDAEIPVRRSLRRPELISGFGFAPFPIATPAQTIFNIVDVTVRFAQVRTDSVTFGKELSEEVRFALIRYVDGEF